MKRLLVNTQRLIVVAVFGLFAVVSLSAQCVATEADPCVSVNQSVINKAGQIADEYRAARDVIAKYQVSDAASQAERAAAQVLIKGLNDLMATKDQIAAEYAKINDLLRKAIEFQQMLIERYEKQLAKPKSGWQKFLATLKEIALVLTGITLGRGL